MVRSFYNGVSGIKTQSFGMDVWANNISNINNVGFKSSTPEYKSIFYQSLALGSMSPVPEEVGLGATKQTTALDMSIGSFQNTDNNLDFAIEGKGFFGVRDGDAGVFYTRAGAFSKDANDILVDTHGRYVQGVMNTLTQASLSEQAKARLGQGVSQAYSVAETDEPLSLAGAITDIRLPQYLYQNAKPTTQVKVIGNLDASRHSELVSSVIDPAAYTYKLSDDKSKVSIKGIVVPSPTTPNPKKGDNVSVVLKDGSGKESQTTAVLGADGSFEINDYALDWLDPENLSVEATLFGEQEIANVQKVSATVVGADGSINTLTMKFTKALPQETDTTTWHLNATITDKNGVELASNESDVVFDGHGIIASGGSFSVGGVSVNLNSTSKDGSYDGITSAANGEKTLSSKADGFRDGALERYYANDSGTIYAMFDNGTMIPMARLALYHFQNEQGLMKMGANIYTQTPNSGQAEFWRDSSGEIIYGATIASNKLEMSNVSLSTALTEVIATQKAYTASSKSITTSDEILQTTIQMKR